MLGEPLFEPGALGVAQASGQTALRSSRASRAQGHLVGENGRE